MIDHDGEYKRVRAAAALHGRESLNELDKWRLDQSYIEEKRAAAKRIHARERSRSRHERSVAAAAATEQAQLREELATLHANQVVLHDGLVDSLRTIGEAIGNIVDNEFDRDEERAVALRNVGDEVGGLRSSFLLVDAAQRELRETTAASVRNLSLDFHETMRAAARERDVEMRALQDRVMQLSGEAA
jgi:hypothetical protein